MTEQQGNIKRLTDREHYLFLKIKQEFLKLGDIDPFSVYNEHSQEINYFSDFSRFVKGKAKAYQQLSFLADSPSSLPVQSQTSILEGTLEEMSPVEREQLESLLKRLDQHKQRHLRIQSKIDELSFLAQEYSYQLKSELFIESESISLLVPSIKLLNQLTVSEGETKNKFASFYEDLKSTKELLNQRLEKQIGKIKEKPDSRATATGKSQDVYNQPENDHKAIMADRSPEKSDIDYKGIPNLINISRIVVRRSENQAAIELSENRLYSSFFFKSENKVGLVNPLTGYGRLVEYKRAEHDWFMRNTHSFVSNKHSFVHMKHFYCFFQNSVLSIDKVTRADGQIASWWEYQGKIKNNYKSAFKAAKRTLDGSALVYNLNIGKIMVIEATTNSDLERNSKRQFEIVNKQGYQTDCFETLPGGRLVTVDRKGLLVLYKLDLEGFTSYSELDNYQIEGGSISKYVFCVCPKGELLCVVFEPVVTEQKSRMIIFRLKKKKQENEEEKRGGKEGEDKINVMASLDLPGRALSDLEHICFTEPIKNIILICGHSARFGVQAFVYDTWREEITCIQTEGPGVFSKCYQLVRFGKEIWGMIEGGNIFRLGIYFSL